MPKFTKPENELTTHFEKWLYILKNLQNLTGRPIQFQERVFKQLFEQAEIAQLDEKEFFEYEESLKEYRDLKNSIDTAFDEGKIEGKIETARIAKAEGLPISFIAKMTGLPESEIELL